MPTKNRDQERALPIAWWLVAAGVFGLVIAIRIRLLGVPLERDEGEYAYAGQLILQGVPPYTLAYNMKFPGTYAAYAAIMSIFGQTITGIHLGLLLVNAATIILVFLLGRQLVNSVVGLTAGMSYAVLSVSPSVLGFAGHATHFCVAPGPWRNIASAQRYGPPTFWMAIRKRVAFRPRGLNEAACSFLRAIWSDLYRLQQSSASITP